jgi:hypothetical protein
MIICVWFFNSYIGETHGEEKRCITAAVQCEHIRNAKLNFSNMTIFVLLPEIG